MARDCPDCEIRRLTDGSTAAEFAALRARAEKAEASALREQTKAQTAAAQRDALAEALRRMLETHRHGQWWGDYDALVNARKTAEELLASLAKVQP
jgi:hypothetical protein